MLCTVEKGVMIRYLEGLLDLLYKRFMSHIKHGLFDDQIVGFIPPCSPEVDGIIQCYIPSILCAPILARVIPLSVLYLHVYMRYPCYQ